MFWFCFCPDKGHRPPEGLLERWDRLTLALCGWVLTSLWGENLKASLQGLIKSISCVFVEFGVGGEGEV